jgi:DNA invertase Pin-like site-specific DNA recombinase
MSAEDAVRRRVAIYTRRAAMERRSAAAQRAACMAAAHANAAEGWWVDGESYDDEGWSGFCLDRPALARLLDDAEAGRVDVILVEHLDRVSRDLRDAMEVVDRLGAAGVELHVVAAPGITVPATAAGFSLVTARGGEAFHPDGNVVGERWA